MMFQHRRGGGRSYPVIMEPLAARRLLSTTLDGTTLHIEGPAADAVIIVPPNRRFINLMTVTLNDSVRYIALSAVTQIDIRSLGGNDKVWVDGTLDSMSYPTSVDG